MSSDLRSRVRLRFGCPLVVAVLLAACGGSSGTATPPPATQASPTSIVTVAPTTEATAAVEPTPTLPRALCVIEKQALCRISVGTYTTAPFERPFTFISGEAWYNSRGSEHGGELETEGAAGIFRWASSIETGFVGEQDAVEIGPQPDDFLAFVQLAAGANGLQVSEPDDITVGGIAGQQIDLQRTDASSDPFGYSIAGAQYPLLGGAKARFIVLDVDGATVVLILAANPIRTFDGHTARVQPMLDSIVWQ